jgi:hypothetical protein
MNPAANMTGQRPATAGQNAARGHRFGHITSRDMAPGGSGREARYRVQDDETGTLYSFGADDIVTEGFRVARIGEQVRFLADNARPGQARYVIRLDLPDVEAYYQ